MGNLLGSPIIEKETHEGVTADGIQYAVSSMQGWRVHMEDAHIAEPNLYAAELIDNSDDIGREEDQNDVAVTFTTVTGDRYRKLELPGHALFGVFDGHGGTFAAAYAGNNLLRVLSRQRKFVAYAKFVKERPKLEAQVQAASARKAQLIRSGLELLEGALCDAFVDLDRELARAAIHLPNPEADTPYHIVSVTPITVGGDDGDNHHDIPADPSHDAKLPTSSSARPLEDEGDSGTTACVVMVTPEWVICANAGDSRAVFSKHGHKAIPLSYDHKPDDEEENRRIRAAGGYVGGGRVEGDLAVSRGFGDFRFKVMDAVLQGAMLGAVKNGSETLRVMRHEDQKVSAVPDIIIQNRSIEHDEFIIIACDGIWDVQTNYEGVKAVADIFDEGEARLGLACEELCDMCLRLGSKDNMTTLIIKFPGQLSGNGGGVLARRKQRDEPNTSAGEAKTTLAGYAYSFNS